MRQRPAFPPRERSVVIGRLVLAAAVVVGSLAFGGRAQRVLAHTDIAFTVPAADETVADPVSTITVAFADPVTLVGAGFEVFTPQEQIVQPTVATDDDTEFLLQLDTPLAGGVVGVRYEVVAADGHIIDGSFTFTVSAPAPAPTIPPATTAPATVPVTVLVTEAPSSTSPPAGANAPATTASPTTGEPTVIAPVPTTTTTVAADAAGGGSIGLVIGVALAAVIAVGAFVVLRTRLRTSA